MQLCLTHHLGEREGYSGTENWATSPWGTFQGIQTSPQYKSAELTHISKHLLCPFHLCAPENDPQRLTLLHHEAIKTAASKGCHQEQMQKHISMFVKPVCDKSNNYY